MDSAVASIVLALLFALAIIAGIFIFTVRRYRAAAPEQRIQMNESYKRSAFMGGGVLIVLGLLSTSQEPTYSSIWWFDVGFIGLGVLLVVASVIGIPAWVVNKRS